MLDHDDIRLRTVVPSGDERWRVAWQHHLLRLDPESRQSRFLAPAKDPTIRAYIATARPVALIVADAGGVMRGCAELHPGEGPGMVEIAVSVETDWQSRGLGHVLTAEATRQAARMGFADIRLTCLRQNLRMMRIARRLSAYRLPVADWALALFRFYPVPEMT